MTKAAVLADSYEVTLTIFILVSYYQIILKVSKRAKLKVQCLVEGRDDEF
jgi:hypothetical protein